MRLQPCPQWPLHYSPFTTCSASHYDHHHPHPLFFMSHHRCSAASNASPAEQRPSHLCIRTITRQSPCAPRSPLCAHCAPLTCSSFPRCGSFIRLLPLSCSLQSLMVDLGARHVRLRSKRMFHGLHGRPRDAGYVYAPQAKGPIRLHDNANMRMLAAVSWTAGLG